MLIEIIITAIIIVVSVLILYKNIKNNLKGKCTGCEKNCGKCIYSKDNAINDIKLTYGTKK